MRFYTGTHVTGWLSRYPGDWFVSDSTLRKVKKHKPAVGEWACDSGGFTELNRNGAWTVPASEYAARLERYRDEIGGLQWAAPQDWMCESVVLRKTGLSVAEHQRRTTDSVSRLRDLMGDTTVAPVIQGDTADDYWRHVDYYLDNGFDLMSERIVGIGSVCRRQNVTPVLDLIRELAECGIRLHAFGFKTTGIRKVGRYLASSDSLAWSFEARRIPVLLDGCEGHINCANCIRYATLWRDRLKQRMTEEWGVPTEEVV